MLQRGKRNFALSVGAETTDKFQMIESATEKNGLSLASICNHKLNISCDEVTALEVGVVVSNDESIESVLETIHLSLSDLQLPFPFYVAANYTTDAIYGCITYANESFNRVELPAPEILVFFEKCLCENYLDQGEDLSEAQSFAEADAGDNLNEFRNYLQRIFALEKLTHEGRRISDLAEILVYEMDFDEEKATGSKAAMKPIVNEFLSVADSYI